MSVITKSYQKIKLQPNLFSYLIINKSSYRNMTKYKIKIVLEIHGYRTTCLKT
jgi:hypothetical protein